MQKVSCKKTSKQEFKIGDRVSVFGLGEPKWMIKEILSDWIIVSAEFAVKKKELKKVKQ